MRIFTSSSTCRSGAHCDTCRDRNNRAWRESLRRGFTLPDDNPDFECPHGKPWGAVGPRTPIVIHVNWPGGATMWRELHTKRDADQAWLDGFTARIPCGECRQHWFQILKDDPPVFGDGFFEWTWRAHGAVNRALGKPSPTLAAARAMYA